MATIIYTHTDEAPLLATYSLQPIIAAFAKPAGINIETRDISLAGRIIAAFSDYLPTSQQINDDLTELGRLTKNPDANIIKLPNISASLPQLKAAIVELQTQGYSLPDYPDDPRTDQEQLIRSRYDKIKGSAVNPVLREGNSDRRAPEPVKNYARKHPHPMGAWSADSKTNVATMSANDFRHNEQSVVIAHDDVLTIQLRTQSGIRILKDQFKVLAGEIVDGTLMCKTALDQFLVEQINRAKKENILFSVHLKATMMKVSDPIIFGHVIKTFFAPVFEKYGAELAAAGLNANDGLAAIFAGLTNLPNGSEIQTAFDQVLVDGPRLAMVDSANSITNLHVPSDVIVDASMPAMIRSSGHMWGPDGREDDTLAVIPDSSYAGVYQSVIDDCRAHGAYDPATMGTVANVGLMAQKAEEYGSHDKTFEITEVGMLEVVDSANHVLIEHEVNPGDIWRACQTKDVAIRDWVKLAVTRTQITGWPAIFWLDPERAHDRNLVTKVIEYLGEYNTEGLDISFQSPSHATSTTLERLRKGKNTISVTGNVLRDYLTDLFPILELGTSAKTLSIVPLLAGGGLFETGAGGSAPKHVKQLVEQNYLRWDSLGEFLALAACFDHLAQITSETKIAVLAKTLDRAISQVLAENKSPGRKLGTIDNRGSHLYLATYWAQELATQTTQVDLASRFIPVARELTANVADISAELLSLQGRPVDIGGYYHPDPELLSAVMRPSRRFNEILDLLD